MIQNTFGYLPEYIVADAGYGSEQNYMAIIDVLIKRHLLRMACLLKIKLESLKVTFLTLKIGNMTYLMMNLYVLITKE